MNMYRCSGKGQHTCCRECDLFQRADVETFLMKAQREDII